MYCFSTWFEENMTIKHVKDSCDMNFMKTFHSTLDRSYSHDIFYILPVSNENSRYIFYILLFSNDTVSTTFTFFQSAIIHLSQKTVPTSFLTTLLHPFRQRQGSEMIVATHLTTHVFHKKSANKETKIHN